ncbi:MAG: isopentenyl-diphosphate delta-isomerase [Exiguobacterium profundum]|nr:MAG: isopentenyl-diphosphate delta-isomerase [Exiguobacterium profundum]
MSAHDQDLIPAWDAEGQLAALPKLDVHRRGLRHKAVSVFVLDGSRVLIQRRAAAKYHTPLLWANTCCTHLWDEDPAACAIRRLREELGITGLSPAFADRVEYRADVGGGMVEHELVDIFVAARPDLAVSPNPEEVAEVRWIDLCQLAAEVRRKPADYTPWLRIYLADHQDTIFGSGLAVP